MKKKILNPQLTRRQVLKAGLFAGAGMMVPWRFFPGKAYASPAAAGLSDPAFQPKFVEMAPNALHPSFKFPANNVNTGKYKIIVDQGIQYTGLIGPSGQPVPTPVWGYGRNGRGVDWPGRTFEVQSGVPIEVKWENKLPNSHLLPVDTSLHWCYSLHGMSSANGVDYRQYSIAKDGVPIVTHLHGGHTDSPFDGNPEYFFSPGYSVRGPRWVDKKFIYANDQPAGNLWYHDHALGITRLNVWAGLAGFYFIRDEFDTGKADNPLGLPAYPYELAYAIQDRMFRNTGELFYSAFPGDPFYEDFIGKPLPTDQFPGGGPTALAEFFGDHMVVNGKIWPKENVEPRNYRMRLLNGCDSRFMVIRFRAAATPTSTDLTGAGAPIPFWVIGSDQGLASAATQTDTLVFEPGSRYDVVFDFSSVPADSRVIMENIGWDAPFGGDFGRENPDAELFTESQTDRIMAFDVTLTLNAQIPDAFAPDAISAYGGNTNTVTNTRKVALFEGMDEFSRLQPLLGVAEPTINADGDTVNGSIAWHSPTTENPNLDSTEIWEIYNATGDAHPVHLHLVNFQVLGRKEFTADVVQQPVLQHNGAEGNGFRLENIDLGDDVNLGDEYVENAPKDMVTALPDQVTRIKMTFDKPGRYVWHCHILSHEDHEMMRVLHVGPGA